MNENLHYFKHTTKLIMKNGYGQTTISLFENFSGNAYTHYVTNIVIIE